MKPLIFTIIMFFNLLLKINSQSPTSIHQFTANSIDGEIINFNLFKGKKILIVNTASKCGLTPQLKELQQLHENFKEKNLVIIGFPTNDFAKQDPGNNSEIKLFCEKNYGIDFLMMAKITLKNDSIHPIYKWLTKKSENGVLNSRVIWNFQKYLINENGHLIDYVSPFKKPNCKKILNWLNKN